MRGYEAIQILGVGVLEFAEIPEYLRPRFFCLLLTNFQFRQSYAICEKLQISARLRQLRGGKSMQQECYISEAIQLFMITECLGVSGQQRGVFCPAEKVQRKQVHAFDIGRDGGPQAV